MDFAKLVWILNFILLFVCLQPSSSTLPRKETSWTAREIERVSSRNGSLERRTRELFVREEIFRGGENEFRGSISPLRRRDPDEPRPGPRWPADSGAVDGPNFDGSREREVDAVHPDGWKLGPSDRRIPRLESFVFCFLHDVQRRSILCWFFPFVIIFVEFSSPVL